MNRRANSHAPGHTLALALLGTLVDLIAPTAHAAPDRTVGSFETYKPALFAGSAPWGIAAGPDGAMCFAEQGTSWISKVGTGKGRLLTTTVKGRSAVGSRMTCAAANTSPWNVASIAHVWLRTGSPIPGATKRTYRLTVDDTRVLISCQASVTFSSSLLQLGAEAIPTRVVKAG